MLIKSKVIEDSVAPNGVRLTTMELSYPRFIHSEFMTHRVFSRNASSSRAIPASKLIDQVRTAPAEPVHWGKNQPGMQALSELEGEERQLARSAWHEAANNAADMAERLNKAGAHKQIVNRVIEPFIYISVIVTATEWENFFQLRAHTDAQPEIQALAFEMKAAMSKSDPRSADSDPNDVHAWHLPYITVNERADSFSPFELAKVSAARCARVSYLTHDGSNPNLEKDMLLYERLVGAKPIHASPVEHQAYPLVSATSWCKNFRGWHQFRADVEAAFS